MEFSYPGLFQIRFCQRAVPLKTRIVHCFPIPRQGNPVDCIQCTSHPPMCHQNNMGITSSRYMLSYGDTHVECFIICMWRIEYYRSRHLITHYNPPTVPSLIALKYGLYG